tara:strand:+ start:483 stop:674 length:192 start_codon:yes stop_codon:yes gene_type:complete
MTVEQLIEKLRTLNPNDEVVIELNHDDIVPLKEDRIVEDIMTSNYRLTTEDYEDSKRVVMIRA